MARPLRIEFPGAIYHVMSVAISGVLTGPNPVVDKAIATGDILFGSTVKDFSLNGSRLGFNDAGQVAFEAHLADGRDVTVRADPIPIPEPTTLTLLGIGTLGVLGYAWRGWRSPSRR